MCSFPAFGGLSLPIQPFTIWEKFLYLSSAPTAQQYLTKQYDLLKIEDVQKKSYENCYPFIYYLEQGKSFFQQASHAPLNIQPILIFYGLVFLIKACLLTVDPEYPKSTTVLAHGVSTRKRKKQQFIYLHDEIKTQKNGLFPHFSEKMFQMKYIEGKKIPIHLLLKQIPELKIFFEEAGKLKTFLPMDVEEGKFLLPPQILDVYKMTKQRLSQYLLSKTKVPIQFSNQQNEAHLSFSLLINEMGDLPIEIVPFRFDLRAEHYFYPTNLNELSFFPELMIHYLILYHLSMIARYEIEWWSDLLHHKSTIDYPIVVHYLQTATEKCPFLIAQYLHFQEQYVKK